MKTKQTKTISMLGYLYIYIYTTNKANAINKNFNYIKWHGHCGGENQTQTYEHIKNK